MQVCAKAANRERIEVNATACYVSRGAAWGRDGLLRGGVGRSRPNSPLHKWAAAALGCMSFWNGAVCASLARVVQHTPKLTSVCHELRLVVGQQW